MEANKIWGFEGRASITQFRFPRMRRWLKTWLISLTQGSRPISSILSPLWYAIPAKNEAPLLSLSPSFSEVKYFCLS